MAQEKESWFIDHAKASSRVITNEEKEAILYWLNRAGAKKNQSKPGLRFKKFGELHENWIFNGEQVFIHTTPNWSDDPSQSTIRIDCSIRLNRKLIKSKVLQRKR